MKRITDTEILSSIKIHTDGSTITNPGKGAWAAIVTYSDRSEEIITKVYTYTTNNRMELLGVLDPLESLLSNMATSYDYDKTKSEIEVFSDSQYVVNSATKWIEGWLKRGWKSASGSDIKNIDLMKRLYIIMMIKRDIKFTWVKGHASNVNNNRCDNIARAATHDTNQSIEIDKGFKDT